MHTVSQCKHTLAYCRGPALPPVAVHACLATCIGLGMPAVFQDGKGLWQGLCTFAVSLCHYSQPEHACYVPEQQRSGIAARIHILAVWCLSAFMGDLGRLVPIHVTTSQFYHMVVCACRFTSLLCASTLIDDLDPTVCTFVIRHDHQVVVAWAYMPVHSLCPSVTLWQTSYYSLHSCSIPELPIGGLGTLVPMHVISPHSLFRYLLCPNAITRWHGYVGLQFY